MFKFLSDLNISQTEPEINDNDIEYDENDEIDYSLGYFIQF